jgi:hypothetical protein
MAAGAFEGAKGAVLRSGTTQKVLNRVCRPIHTLSRIVKPRCTPVTMICVASTRFTAPLSRSVQLSAPQHQACRVRSTVIVES